MPGIRYRPNSQKITSGRTLLSWFWQPRQTVANDNDRSPKRLFFRHVATERVSWFWSGQTVSCFMCGSVWSMHRSVTTSHLRDRFWTLVCSCVEMTMCSSGLWLSTECSACQWCQWWGITQQCAGQSRNINHTLKGLFMCVSKVHFFTPKTLWKIELWLIGVQIYTYNGRQRHEIGWKLEEQPQDVGHFSQLNVRMVALTPPRVIIPSFSFQRITTFRKGRARKLGVGLQK